MTTRLPFRRGCLVIERQSNGDTFLWTEGLPDNAIRGARYVTAREFREGERQELTFELETEVIGEVLRVYAKGKPAGKVKLVEFLAVLEGR